MFKPTLRLIAAIQIILGLAYLFVPVMLLKAVGHSVPPHDINYPFGMLAARFIVYGLGLWMVSYEHKPEMKWVRLMALIQLIDLGVGIYYTAQGVVQLTTSAFPMFNAVWIGLVCAFIRAPVQRA